MFPFLKPLDICTSKEIVSSRVRTGDIVIYRNTANGVLNVHRVLSVNGKKNYALLKGDNSPYGSSEKVPFSDLKGKVVSVRKGKQVYDLGVFHRRLFGRIIAFLSRYDLTPLLFKRRFIDPAALRISRNSLYVFLRSPLYGDIKVKSERNGTQCSIHVFVGRGESAEAIMDINENRLTLTSCYIRRRDRNRLFIDRFMQKAVETADKEYGPQYDIYVDKSEIKKLLHPTDRSVLPGRIRFLWECQTK